MSSDENTHYTYLLPTNVQPIKDFSVNIFAFTATLLGTEMLIPTLTQIQDLRLSNFFATHGRIFMIYIASFLNISNFWMVHYIIFENIIRANRALIRLNIFLMLSVTFLPYPSHLMSQFGRNSFVASFYGIVLSCTYLLLTLMILYAYTNKHLVNPEIHLPIRKFIVIKGILPLMVTILATILAAFFPRLSYLIYFLVAVNLLIPVQRIFKGIEIKEEEV